jgi:microcystin-dependent protein
MSQPYVGEIRMFGGNFAPAGWMFCDGQTLPISENDTLFNLIGTTYGGDGQETFNLPNLQSRVPLHAGTGPGGITYQLGEAAGVESVTLTVNQIPNHTHPLAVTNNGQVLAPTTSTIIATPTGGPQGAKTFVAAAADTQLSNTSILPTGGSQPHDNMQQYLVINFIISLFGIYPSPN